MTIWLEIGGQTRKVELPTTVDAAGKVDIDGERTCELDGRPIRVKVRTLEQGAISLQIVGEQQYHCTLDSSAQGDAVVIDGQRVLFTGYDPRLLRARRSALVAADGPKTVKSPLPGRVVRVLVAEGDTVQAQQGLVVVEAMKMQNELKSPKAGRVTRLSVAADATVQTGEALMVVV
jgi:biotin carboxyl carrier protein